MTPHKAKRHDTGEYEYRGYLILDHGGGTSVHSAIMRSGPRWSVRPMIESYYKRGPHGLPYVGFKYSLKEAKRAIDRALLQEITYGVSNHKGA